MGIEHYLNPSTTLAFDITQINYNGKSSELQERTYFDCMQYETEIECSMEPFCKWDDTTCINEVEQSSMVYNSDDGSSLNYGFGYFNDINENEKLSVEFDYDNHDHNNHNYSFHQNYHNHDNQLLIFFQGGLVQKKRLSCETGKSFFNIRHHHHHRHKDHSSCSSSLH